MSRSYSSPFTTPGTLSAGRRLLRRLAGECDELQVGSELGLEVRVAATADRPGRILVDELLAAARAALLGLLQIRLVLHVLER